jgi:predicted nuclease of predicted toxin-antitoxin system
MRFLAHMGISPRTVEFLRQRGHDAVHLHEEGLGLLVDEEVMRRQSRKSGSCLPTIWISAAC